MKIGAHLLATVLLVVSNTSLAFEWQATRLLEFTVEVCSKRDSEGGPNPEIIRLAVEQSPIEVRGMRIGSRYRFKVDEGATVELKVIERGGQPSRFIGSLYNRFGDPLLLIAIDAECGQQVAREINYTDHGQALSIVSLDDKLEVRGDADWINPPLEFQQREAEPALKHPGDTTPLRIGMVDSGINYNLPEINRRLARDSSGKLIGFDFWDMDVLPYDAHPVNSGFFVQRHGTRTASLLLREVSGIELVPYRYPRPDMSRMQALIEHADRHQVTIIGMPLGSNRLEDWGGFEQAARDYPQMLFIVSAGNDGRNIDERAVYPASLGLENMLVVTSADDFVRPAERTNWGQISVDYLVPAEHIWALDYSGAETRVSGSSFAVARVVALVARLKQAHRQWQAADIIAELRRRYTGIAPAAERWVSSGYIADPLAGGPLQIEPLPELKIELAAKKGRFGLPLEILVLDPHWTQTRIEQTLQRAYEVLAQCAIIKANLSAHKIEGEDYLRDLSVGSAQTLLASASSDNTTVVFARDTRMQAQYTGEAFGLGNTRMRPWLVNSVWLMLDVDDAGVALAHELYHVLANSGAHVESSANLMQGRTSPDSVALTPEQCRLAQVTGVANQLLLD